VSVPQQYVGELIVQNDVALTAYTPVSTAGKLYNVAGVLYWAGTPLTGTGTVSSFSAGDLVPLFTSSVATATSTPALTFALKTTAANKVLAGPVSGADAAWAARLLVAADIPDLSATYEPLLAYTPENVANKSTVTTLGVSDTFYPSQKAVKTYADTKEPALGNPAVNGYVLSSTTLGVRSWVVQSGGGSSGHDPTASHATNAAINGVAATFMRSDAVPAITTTAVFQLGRIGLGTAAHATLVIEAVGTHVSGVGIARFKGDSTSGFMTLDTTTAASGEAGFLLGCGGTLIGQFGARQTDNKAYIKNRVFGTTEVMTFDSSGQAAVVTATDTSSTTTGSLITAGGIGIAKALWVGTTVRIASTTDASSSITGAAIISGGIGIAKAAWIGGIVNITPSARTSGVASYFTLTTPADTAQTLSTESIGANFTAATRTWATGALTLQRERVFAAPTYAFAGDSTITTAINADFADPIAGAHATLTNSYSVRAANVLFTGVIKAGSGPTTLTNATGVLLLAAFPTQANNTILGNISGGIAAPSALTGANVRTICVLATTDAPTFAGATLTGALSVQPAAAADALNVVGYAGHWAAIIQGGAGASNSYGFQIQAGTNSDDYCMQFLNKATATLGYMRGDGFFNWAGKVGIAGAVQMSNYGAGAATFDSSGNLSSVSDERAKDMVGDFKTGLDVVRKLQPKTYHWKKTTGLCVDDLNASLTAQDLLAAGLTEAVFTQRTVAVMEDFVDPFGRHQQRPSRDADGNIITKKVDASYTVADRAIIAALVNAIKELADEIDQLKAI
jgi:hypothetical protein